MTRPTQIRTTVFFDFVMDIIRRLEQWHLLMLKITLEKVYCFAFFFNFFFINVLIDSINLDYIIRNQLFICQYTCRYIISVIVISCTTMLLYFSTVTNVIWTNYVYLFWFLFYIVHRHCHYILLFYFVFVAVCISPIFNFNAISSIEMHIGLFCY